MRFPVTGRGTCLRGRRLEGLAGLEGRRDPQIRTPPSAGTWIARMRVASETRNLLLCPTDQATGHSYSTSAVRDCMHAGVLTCSADTPLVEVAGIMTKHRVHAVAVIDDKQRAIGVVSALDVVAAASQDEHERATARVATATEPLITISTDAPLDRAAKLMTKHRVHHLVAVDPANGHPVGIVSTLDIAVLVAENSER